MRADSNKHNHKQICTSQSLTVLYFTAPPLTFHFNPERPRWSGEVNPNLSTLFTGPVPLKSIQTMTLRNSEKHYQKCKYATLIACF